VDDQIVLDPMKEEDNFGQADMPIAMTPNGELTLLQMDGRLTKEEFHQALELAKAGCKQIYELQRRVLIDRYCQMERSKEEPAQEAQVYD
jgi:exosome complex component RRP41